MINEHEKNKKLTFCAMMTAIGIIVMLVAEMIPGLRLAGAAIAGVAAALSVVECGLSYGILTVIATGIAAILVVPAREIALLYLLFFGPYTIVKNVIERLKHPVIEWIIKLVLCLADAWLLIRFLDKIALMIPSVLASKSWMIFPVIGAAFIAYDIVFSKLIAYVYDSTHSR